MDSKQAPVSRVNYYTLSSMHFIWNYCSALAVFVLLTHRGELHICKYVIKVMKLQQFQIHHLML